MIVQVHPGLPCNQPPHRSDVHAELPRESVVVLSGKSTGEDGYRLPFSQSGERVPLAASGEIGAEPIGVPISTADSLGMGVSSVVIAPGQPLRMQARATSFADGLAILARHVRHVVTMCPQEQVCIVAAGPAITVVTAVEALGNLPVLEFPGYAVGEIGTVFDVDGAVALGIERPGPRPAAIWACGPINLGPEAVSKRLLQTEVVVTDEAPARLHKETTTAGAEQRGHAILSEHGEPSSLCPASAALQAPRGIFVRQV